MALRLLVFDRAHVCVHDRLFVDMEPGERTESMQLVLGMCHTLGVLLGRMAPACSAGARGPPPSLPTGLLTSMSLKTSRYALHAVEVVTGWRIVLVVRRDAPGADGRAAAEALFAEVVVPAVVRSPMAEYASGVSALGHANGRGSWDAFPGLRERTDAFLRSRQLIA